MNRFDLQTRYSGFELSARAEWEASSVALFGASGSGKSTVLEALAGLRPEVTGVVELGGRRLDGLAARERRIGWVPQDAALFPHMTVRENLTFGAESGASRGAGGAVGRLAGALEIEPLLDRSATDLSGGERQRVAIARALVSRPAHLLLDEPLASIDRPLRSRLLPFLEELPARTGVPVFFVTHDPLEVLALAEHVLVIEAGRVVSAGDPRGVFAAAASFGAVQALGAENRFDVRVLEPRGGTTIVETTGGARLSMVRVEGFPSPTRVAIRAEDVMLAERDPGKVSAQNVFEARTVAVEAVGEQVLVDLFGAGEHWRVKVTGSARDALRIEPGRALVLLIKAHAIVPIGPVAPDTPGAPDSPGRARGDD